MILGNQPFLHTFFRLFVIVYQSIIEKNKNNSYLLISAGFPRFKFPCDLSAYLNNCCIRFYLVATCCSYKYIAVSRRRKYIETTYALRWCYLSFSTCYVCPTFSLAMLLYTSFIYTTSIFYLKLSRKKNTWRKRCVFSMKFIYLKKIFYCR